MQIAPSDCHSNSTDSGSWNLYYKHTYGSSCFK